MPGHGICFFPPFVSVWYLSFVLLGFHFQSIFSNATKVNIANTDMDNNSCLHIPPDYHYFSIQYAGFPVIDCDCLPLTQSHLD